MSVGSAIYKEQHVRCLVFFFINWGNLCRCGGVVWNTKRAKRLFTLLHIIFYIEFENAIYTPIALPYTESCPQQRTIVILTERRSAVRLQRVLNARRRVWMRIAT